MHTSTFYGFWDYWQLRHKVTFDGVNRLIIINQGVTEIDVQRDIYSAWKEWVLQEQNSKFLQALTTVGGEPTIAGQFLDATYFLINGWRLKPYAGSYTLDIIGNIFDVDGGQIFLPAEIDPAFPNNININTNTSVIVRRISTTDASAGGGLLPDERTALFNIEDIVQNSDNKMDIIQDQLNDIDGDIFNIENRIISIQSILENPITAKLDDSERDVLLDIQAKILEVWRIHGLDIANPMTVSKESREAGDISQTLEQIGESVKVTRK